MVVMPLLFGAGVTILEMKESPLKKELLDPDDELTLEIPLEIPRAFVTIVLLIPTWFDTNGSNLL